MKLKRKEILLIVQGVILSISCTRLIPWVAVVNEFTLEKEFEATYRDIHLAIKFGFYNSWYRPTASVQLKNLSEDTLIVDTKKCLLIVAEDTLSPEQPVQVRAAPRETQTLILRYQYTLREVPVDKKSSSSQYRPEPSKVILQLQGLRRSTEIINLPDIGFRYPYD